MSTNVYEGMFLVDVNKWSNDPEGLTAELTGLLEKQGAEVLVARPWDERRLAYPIRGQRKALYLMSSVRDEGSKIHEIENLKNVPNQYEKPDVYLVFATG